MRLNKNKIYIWRNLWDFRTQASKDCDLLAQELSLSSTGLIPSEELFRINTGMPGLFSCDLEWFFKWPFKQYDSDRIYPIFHKSHALGPFFNFGWVASDKESQWIQRFHNFWAFILSYKLYFLVWLVIYEGIP